MCAEEVFIVLQLRWLPSVFCVYHCVPSALANRWVELSLSLHCSSHGRRGNGGYIKRTASFSFSSLAGWLITCVSSPSTMPPLTQTLHSFVGWFWLRLQKIYINLHQLCFGLPVLSHALNELMMMDGWYKNEIKLWLLKLHTWISWWIWLNGIL